MKVIGLSPKFDDFLKINHKANNFPVWELFGLYELSYKIGITMTT